MEAQSFRRLSLASSCLFAIGSVFALVAYFAPMMLDTGDPNDRAAGAIIEILGWSLIAASVVPEVYVDIALILRGDGRRPEHHGRYGKDLYPMISWLQSTFFLVGAVCQGMAGKRSWDDDESAKSRFFRERNYRLDWQDLLLLAAVMLTLSGALAVFATGCCCCAGSDGSGRQRQVVIQTANAMYLGSSIALILAVFNSCDQCFLGFFVTIGVRILFCVIGISWIVADAALSTTEDKPSENQDWEDAPETQPKPQPEPPQQEPFEAQTH